MADEEWRADLTVHALFALAYRVDLGRLHKQFARHWASFSEMYGVIHAGALDIVFREAQLERGGLMVDLGAGGGNVVAFAALAFGAQAVGMEVRRDRVTEGAAFLRGVAGAVRALKMEEAFGSTELVQADLRSLDSAQRMQISTADVVVRVAIADED